MGMIVTSINTFQKSILKMRLKFDISKIKLVTLDIEVGSESGFPDVESCIGRDPCNLYSGLYN
jgi:hypothetical protein